MNYNQFNINKLFIFIISFILVISLTSATIESLPDYVKINDCVNLVQNDNVNSEVLISVVKPNGIDYINSNMTKNNSFFNYTFCNNTVSGAYTVNGIDNTGTVWSYDYNVNAQGKAYTTVDGLLYILSILVLFVSMGLSIWAFIGIPFENNRGSEGNLISINYMKYLKIFAFMMAYVSALGISYFLWNLTYGILEVQEMASFFYFIYRTLFVFLLVLFPLITVLSFVKFLKDKGLETMIQRGLTVK